MTDPDRLLAEVFAADEPPDEDAAFVLALIERLERRRLRLELGGLVLASAVAGLVCWAFAPVVQPMLRMLGRVAFEPSSAAVAGAGVMAAWLCAWVYGRAGLSQA